MDKFQKYKDYKTIISVNVLIWCKGKVLLLKRSEKKSIDPGVYSGIGGKVEPGESVYEAIVREAEEEAGIKDLGSLRVFSITQHPYPPTECEWVNIYFNATMKEMPDIPKSDEGEFHWVEPKDVDSLNMVHDLQEYIKILSKDPNAFILGFFNYDKSGKLAEKTIEVL